MSITLNVGRQEVVAAKVDVGFADPASDAAVGEAIMQLPAGAIVVGGHVMVNEVFNSTTSDVLDLGDADDDNRYTSTQIDLTALGRTALDLTGFEYVNESSMLAEWTAGSTGTATTGQFDLVVEYIVDGRAAFSQG